MGDSFFLRLFIAHFISISETPHHLGQEKAWLESEVTLKRQCGLLIKGARECEAHGNFSPLAITT